MIIYIYIQYEQSSELSCKVFLNQDNQQPDQ